MALPFTKYTIWIIYTKVLNNRLNILCVSVCVCVCVLSTFLIIMHPEYTLNIDIYHRCGVIIWMKFNVSGQKLHYSKLYIETFKVPEWAVLNSWHSFHKESGWKIFKYIWIKWFWIYAICISNIFQNSNDCLLLLLLKMGGGWKNRSMNA